MDRNEVTSMIIAAKVRKGIKWADVAKAVGRGKAWTMLACLGQMQMTKAQAEVVGKLFELPEEAVKWLLQVTPYNSYLLSEPEKNDPKGN
jgi:cyanate lyase